MRRPGGPRSGVRVAGPHRSSWLGRAAWLIGVSVLLGDGVAQLVRGEIEAGSLTLILCAYWLLYPLERRLWLRTGYQRGLEDHLQARAVRRDEAQARGISPVEFVIGELERDLADLFMGRPR